MNQHDSTFHCDAPAIDAYLSGSLLALANEQFESHLVECKACRLRLDSVAAPSSSWSDVQTVLPSDSFDSKTDDLVCSAPSGIELSRDADSDFSDQSMLLREIKGWLDPTDDPRMIGRFAGYEIVGIIGHGGMGIVLKGFEACLNRYVAIKTMAPRLATSGPARKRFAREAQAAAAVLHENVIAIHRVDQFNGLPFLVMPYIAGESLQKRIDNDGPLTVETTLRIAAQIAEGLAAAHAKGLVHRDVKPANILLQPGIDRVTITDFGLARAADDVSMTRTGVIAGTPQFMSPEQASGGVIDARSDLFSLGSVMYMMASGRVPFRGDGSHEVIARVRTETAHSLCEIISPIPSWLVRLIERLHEKSPSERPASADEARGLIERCLLHSQDDSSPLPACLVTPTSSGNMLLGRPIGRLAIAAGMVTVLAISVAGLWYMSDTDESNLALDQSTKSDHVPMASEQSTSERANESPDTDSLKTVDQSVLPYDNIEELRQEMKTIENDIDEIERSIR